MKVAVSYTLWKECDGATPEADISGNPELYKSVPHKSRSQIAYLDEWRCDRVVYQIRHGIIQDTSGANA